MADPTLTTVNSYNRRLSMVTIFLASMALLLVTTSVAAFIYVTRKEKILRRFHLIAALLILLVEVAFFIAVVLCCVTPSRNSLGQMLAAFLIVISLLALMTLVYFLLEDMLKEKVEPYPRYISPFKPYEIQEVKSISRHDSPVTMPADDAATPILNLPMLMALPRLPTPPIPNRSSPMQDQPFSLVEKSVPIVDFDKVRRDLLNAIDARTILALEAAIQQVKDNHYFQQLKYECERALELLNRLIKIEHMKIRVLRLNQATIAELHSYTKPPEEVSTVMRATFLLLGHSEREIQEWPQIQSLLGRLGKESVRRRCYELNPLGIPVDKSREAKSILRHYDLIRVSEISVGLAAFFSWAMTMIEEREKLLESQGNIVR